MQRAVFKLEDVSFSYPFGEPILNSVNIEIFEQDKILLRGHNGSGKTTFVHLLMGLNKVSAGKIFFYGKELKKDSDFVDVRKKVGFLFQQADDQLFCPTVLDDVAFGPLNMGLSREDARDISLKTLSSLGLEGYEDKVSYRLSGGERKLVSLATVLSMKPECLILDEPTNDLDPDMRKRLSNILQDLKIPMIVISHDLNFAREVAEIEYICNNGILVKS